MESNLNSKDTNVDLNDWKTEKKQLVINLVENEKDRRYKRYKRKHKELKDLGVEWEKCQENDKKRKEEEETRRKYISGNQVNRDEIKKKLSSSQHGTAKIHKKEYN